MRLPLPLLTIAVLLAAGTAQAKPFVFVSLPDTQIYAENRFPGQGSSPPTTDPRGTGAIFFDQTEWIVENAEALDIRYVGHLGDIVQDGNKITEWELAKDAMDLLLDADIPHGTVMGNHDDNPGSHGVDYMRNYLDYFGPQEFAGRPWYTASSPGGGANVQFLDHEGYKLGFLNFSIDHPQSEIDWAQGIVQDNPDRIFIIGTHRYLYDFRLGGARFGEDTNILGIDLNLPQGFVPNIVEGNSAEELYNEFVITNPNILMIHAGHFHSEWLRLDARNPNDDLIIQILTDYQSTRNGGDGYLRVYELDFEADELRFHTYSPTLDRRRTTIDHFIETIFFLVDQRGQIKDVLGIQDDATYFATVELLLKPQNPQHYLLQHPDLDEPHEKAYYDQYWLDLFEGNPPPGFENYLDWENLWSAGFAADRDNVLDFRDHVRSPNGVVHVDFDRYFTPDPIAEAFAALIAAFEAFEREDLFFKTAGHALARRVARAQAKWENGDSDKARFLLDRFVLDHVDGCAERGRPDRFWGFLWWIFWLFGWEFHALDWVDTCDAQAVVHGPLVELIGLLE